uniref:Fibronectin type-III domain-containing protein n=1 Tax=Salarias fasciatus TaxID=181472 RepID=A0A672I008_SALFA
MCVCVCVCVFVCLCVCVCFYVSAASRCDVHCSTDYVRSVNCSCSVTLRSQEEDALLLCFSGEDQNVVGSCAVAPPRSWCLVLMEDLEEVASVGTKCWTTVSGPDGEALEKSDWQLADWVKPPAPTDVRVTDAGRSANVTWSHAGDDDCLEYNICVREASEQREVRLQQPTPVTTQQRLLLDGGLLQLRPGAALLVRVQARFCETHFVTGPWSEWSPAAAWSPAGERGPAGERAPAAAWCFVSLPVVVLALFLFLQKKLELVTFVPKPDHFFKPLYQNYRGNFKVRGGRVRLDQQGDETGPAGGAIGGQSETGPAGGAIGGAERDWTSRGSQRREGGDQCGPCGWGFSLAPHESAAGGRAVPPSRKPPTPCPPCPPPPPPPPPPRVTPALRFPLISDLLLFFHLQQAAEQSEGVRAALIHRLLSNLLQQRALLPRPSAGAARTRSRVCVYTFFHPCGDQMSPQG